MFDLGVTRISVSKAFSILSPVFADVSIEGIPSLLASSVPSTVVITLSDSKSVLFPTKT